MHNPPKPVGFGFPVTTRPGIRPSTRAARFFEHWLAAITSNVVPGTLLTIDFRQASVSLAWLDSGITIDTRGELNLGMLGGSNRNSHRKRHDFPSSVKPIANNANPFGQGLWRRAAR